SVLGDLGGRGLGRRISRQHRLMGRVVSDSGDMTSTAEDQVQLGWYDVPARVLAAAGVALADLVGVQGAASADTMLGPPPTLGWRVISGVLPPPPGELVMLAAPWTGPPWDYPSNGWMQVSFTYRMGKWSACINEDRTPVRPGRMHRRTGLRLDCLEPSISASPGPPPSLPLNV